MKTPETTRPMPTPSTIPAKRLAPTPAGYRPGDIDRRRQEEERIQRELGDEARADRRKRNWGRVAVAGVVAVVSGFVATHAGDILQTAKEAIPQTQVIPTPDSEKGKELIEEGKLVVVTIPNDPSIGGQALAQGRTDGSIVELGDAIDAEARKVAHDAGYSDGKYHAGMQVAVPPLIEQPHEPQR